MIKDLPQVNRRLIASFVTLMQEVVSVSDKNKVGMAILFWKIQFIDDLS